MTTSRRLRHSRVSSNCSRSTRADPSSRYGCSGSLAACPPDPRWCPSSAGATPIVRRRCCSAASFARTRRAPGWSPASRRRWRSCATAGATPPSRRTLATSPGSSCGALRWRSNASNYGCWAPSTSRLDWSSRRSWRRTGFARGSTRSPARRWSRQARCSTNSRRAGVGSRSTSSRRSGGRSSAAVSTRTSTTTAPRSRRCGPHWRHTLRCCCSRTAPTSTARSCRWRCRRTGCRRSTRSPGSTCRSG